MASVLGTPQIFTLPDNRPLEYRLSGPPDAPVVLLANSLSAPLTAWDPVVPAIAAKGLRVLNLNQPGHGASGVPQPLTSTTFPSIAADIHALLTGLGISQLHAFVGVSMGAATSFYYATAYPSTVRKLVVCDTIAASPRNAGVDDAFGPRIAAAREAGDLRNLTEQTLQRWFGEGWLAGHPAEAARMRALMNTTTVDGFEACVAALRSDTFDVRPLFRQVGGAVDEAMLVVGENDADLPKSMAVMRDEVEAGFKDAGKADRKVELKVIKGAGHVCFIDGYEQFVSDVVSFL